VQNVPVPHLMMATPQPWQSVYNK